MAVRTASAPASLRRKFRRSSIAKISASRMLRSRLGYRTDEEFDKWVRLDAYPLTNNARESAHSLWALSQA